MNKHPARQPNRRDDSRRTSRTTTSARHKMGAALVAAATLSVLSPHHAAAQGSSDAAEMCRRPDIAALFERFGGTFGECVNLAKHGFAPPSRDQSDAVTAAYCGLDHSLVVQGVTNKGQCIKVVREFLATLP